MPKETIRGHHNYSEPRTRDDPTPLVGLGVQVNWGRDAEYVQVATSTIRELGFATDGAMHVDLNRAGINNLIRVLRKARDQAFGADA